MASVRKKQVKKECCDGESRRAVGVDVDIKGANLRRLSRIEGQVRGVIRMIEEDRYCADVVVQVAAAREALRGVGNALMRNHLKHCAAKAIRSGDESAAMMTEELLDLMSVLNA
jgi:DNA-binding FrmR family transcriptional regulator